ncbi:LTA synthase family protein [Fictibacillus norfolkensis]|uniref:LTA synthase family protein n=1 Tax=Fictibacillus norfolkensis TaxID=2762233 RepID=A0ABR8SJA2_9BACL|nr:LTA synthase family protein [Fictibacillus norfolkensis]MBD7963194.1 LTA synthase family protein [Fictibacillus norfolkensis]
MERFDFLYKRIIGNPVIIYSAVLLIKLLIVRYILFDEVEFVKTLTTDMLFFLLFISLAALSPIGKRFNLFLVNFLASIFFFILIVYVKYYQILPTYFDLFQVNQLGTVKEDIFDLIKPIYFIVFIDVVILMFIFLKKNFQVKISLVSSLALLCIIGIAAQFYMNKNEQITDVLAMGKNKGVFQYEMIQYYQDKTIPALANYKDISNKEIYSLKDNEQLKNIDKKFNGVGQDKNLIIIQLESFQNFLINLKVDGTEVTPTLNSLVKDSMYFSNTYQQIGAGNTSDAEFLINTSLYPAGNKPSSKIYANKVMPSLPRLLSNKGYFTATFHADNVEYWNRIMLYPALGFDKYYEKSFFGNEDVIGFGPSDEVLYKKTLKELDELKRKHDHIYAHVLSMTSHTPFELPTDKQRLKLPSEYQQTKIGNYLSSTHYADYALGEFINGLKQQELWNDSIVVIYGDHSGYHPKKEDVEDKKLTEKILGHPYGLVDRFNIPFLIHVPGDYKGTIDNLGGQIDIMPTVANILGMSLDKQIHFGNDLLNHKNNLLGMRYYLPAGSYIDKNYLFINREEGKGEVYNLHTKRLIKDSSSFYEESSVSIKKKEKILKLLNLSDYYLNKLPEKEENPF